MYIYIYIYTYMCVYMYVFFIYIYIYIYTYINAENNRTGRLFRSTNTLNSMYTESRNSTGD